ncbi:translocation/assembly module TamB domain-containing protein [Sneathiella aquimaris]|uniref:translocation/assembly module TamB domain-containing protein n=1 Tax=Sneathiella aquimaris TaxID=2599305 RepID=UPI00146D166D|nr:translocation/assembly module TamB domain-containing protein [Sneathiella aquimaris]
MVRSFFRKVGMSLLTLVAVMVLAMAGAYTFLQTQAGRNFLVSQVEEAAKQEGGLSIGVGSLQGNVFDQFSIASLTLNDPVGRWMRLEGGTISWSPLHLLQGRLQIAEISFNSVTVQRQPDLPASSQSDEGTTGFPKLPVRLSLSKFSIDKLSLEEPVLGQESILGVSLALNSRLDDTLVSRFSIVPLDALQDSVHSEVFFDPAKNHLGVTAELNGAQGGFFSRLLKLPGLPALSGSIVGDGPIEGWRGQVIAQADGLFSSDLLVEMDGLNQTSLKLSGGLHLEESVATSIPLIDNRRISIVGSFLFDADKQDVTLNSLTIENPNLQTVLTGKIDLAAVKGALDVSSTVKNISAVNALLSNASLQAASSIMHLSGGLKKISIKANTAADGLAIAQGEGQPSLQVKTITNRLITEIQPENLVVVPFETFVTATGITNLPPQAAQLLGTSLTAEAKGHFSGEQNQIDIFELSAAASHLTMFGGGSIALGNGPSKATASVTLDQMQTIIPSIEGRVQADVTASSANLAEGLAGKIDLSVSGLNVGDPDIQRLVGTALEMGAQFSVDSENIIVSDLNAPLAIGRIQGGVQFSGSFETITGAFQVEVPQLEKLDAIAGVALRGTAFVQSDLSGPLMDPDINGAMQVSSLHIDGLPLGQLQAEFQVENPTSSLNAKVSGALSGPKIDTNLSATIKTPNPSIVSLLDILVEQKGNSIKGALDISLNSNPHSGILLIDFPDLAGLASIAGQQASGRLSGRVELSNSLENQKTSVSVNVRDLAYPQEKLSVGTLDGQAEAVGAFSDPKILLSLTGNTMTAGNVALPDVTMKAEGQLTELAFSASFTSPLTPTYNINTIGHIRAAETKKILFLETFSGQFLNKPVDMKSPVTAEYNQGSMALSPVSLSIGDGELQAQGNLNDQQTKAKLLIKALPLDLLNVLMPEGSFQGVLDAEASVEIAEQQTNGNFSLTLNKAVLVTEDYPDLPALSSHLNGAIKNGAVDFDWTVAGLDETAIQASGNVPLRVSLKPLGAELPAEGAIDIQAAIKSDIGKIWDLAGLDKHLLSGILTADGRVQGTVSKPKYFGQVQLEGGRYEEIQYGTILKNLELSMITKDASIFDVRAQATDREDGRASLSGRIFLDEDTQPSVDMLLTLEQMQLIYQDALKVATDANLRMLGGPNDLSVTGDVRTRDIDVSIAGTLAADVVDMPVTLTNFPQDLAQENPQDEPPAGPAVRLGVAVDIPQRLFIRGRGLDSEWAGKFTLKGTSDAPIIEGSLSPVRGQFSFSGKDFKLQDGSIRLLGNKDINPELSLSAKYEGKNVTAVVHIEGTANNPIIRFSSPDDLPEDEVLARVLFGKSAAKLSALEAVQLAQAISSVSGGAGFGGITDFARQALGVDVLSAGINEDTGSAEVSAGKYITDQIYVGVSQGGTAGSTSAKVEIEVTPNVKVESKTDQSSNSSVGVFWKWDY